MNELFTHLLIVLVPLIITSTFHMVVVKKKCLIVLEIPIWLEGFGENKTWRRDVFCAVNQWLMLVVDFFRLRFAVGLSIFARVYLGIKLFNLRITQLVFETQNGNQTREPSS